MSTFRSLTASPISTVEWRPRNKETPRNGRPAAFLRYGKSEIDSLSNSPGAHIGSLIAARDKFSSLSRAEFLEIEFLFPPAARSLLSESI
jgi:hypothetical protein